MARNPIQKWFGNVANAGGNAIRSFTGAEDVHQNKMKRLDNQYQQLTAKRDRKKLGY